LQLYNFLICGNGLFKNRNQSTTELLVLVGWRTRGSSFKCPYLDAYKVANDGLFCS